jgi:hypothetical protein
MIVIGFARSPHRRIARRLNQMLGTGAFDRSLIELS